MMESNNSINHPSNELLNNFPKMITQVFNSLGFLRSRRNLELGLECTLLCLTLISLVAIGYYLKSIFRPIFLTKGIIVTRDQRFLKFVTDYEYECNTAECRKNLNTTRSRAVSHPGTTHYEYNTSFY